MRSVANEHLRLSRQVYNRNNKIFRFSKEDVYIDPSLKPLNLNVQKAFELIEKFSMVHQKKKKLEIENA